LNLLELAEKIEMDAGLLTRLRRFTSENENKWCGRKSLFSSELNRDFLTNHYNQTFLLSTFARQLQMTALFI